MNITAPTTRLPRLLAAGLACASFAGALAAQAPPPKQPLRIDNWIGGPDYLRFSGQHRTRFESLNGQFRDTAALRDNEDQLANRSILRVDYERNAWSATVEGLDGRMFGTKADSFADTTTVNTLDLLQATIGYDLGELAGGRHRLTVGRYTMDIGSRRLSARNVYRNTINSFNGVRWDWRTDDGRAAGVFWNTPTERRPSSRAELVDNEHDWDNQTLDYQFFGAHYTRPVDANSSGQAYVLGLDDDRSNASQELVTVGLRYLRPARRGHVFSEFEGAYQFGDRPGGIAVSAWFAHGSLGYQWDSSLEPTVRVAYDLATGDDDAGDDEYNRFNTLFGARRFEYGPTGIYGAVGRRNLISPEIRFSLRPSPNTWVMVAWRDVRLESGNDQWVEARDGTGQGRNIGQQTECRLRWEPCKSNLRFETGGAYLSGGTFRDTSTSGRGKDTRYFFFETIFTF